MPISKINTSSITDNSVTAGKIVAGAVDADIAAGSIDTAQMADDAVTADKLANSINTSIAAALPKAGGTMTGKLTLPVAGLDLPTINSYITGGGHNVLQVDATKTYLYGGTGGVQFRTADNASALVDINNSGNVGVGVTPEAWLSSQTALQFGGVGTVSSTTAQAAGGDVRLSNNTYINTSDLDKYTVTDEASMYRQINGTHIWYVAPSGTADATVSWATAMTIANDGDVGINTSSPSAKLHIAGANAAAAVKIVGGATNGYYNLEIQNNTSNSYGVAFKHGGSIVGSIRTTGSSTSYNTSSDYRLKENVTPMSGATAQTKLLKPCNFDWIAGGNVNGFLAHELAEVVPEAVVGTKDAMMDEEYEVTPAVVDDEGNETTAAVMGTRSVPDLQGIDQSKLVPLLTATIQELIASIETQQTTIESLTTRITALEDA